MSDTPRSYSHTAESFGFSGRRRRRGRATARFVIAATVLCAAYVLWIARDTHPMEEFVARDQRLHLVVSDVVRDRERIAGSKIWTGLPDSVVPPDVSERLLEDFGLPEWVLRNVIGGGAILTANDLESLSDRLFITQMTTVGCVLERFHRLVPGIRPDWAGGLRLRRLDGADLYYAVRGRTLVASPSRAALVRTLALPEEERQDVAALQQTLADAGVEDARGTLQLDPESEWGDRFEDVRFALRIDRDEGWLRLRASFRPDWEARLSRTLGNLEPKTLPRPLAGPLAISGNLGRTIKETWGMLGEVFGIEWMSRERWEEWEFESDGASVPSALTALLGPLGPGFRVTWHGMDLNEMAPTPILVSSIEGDRAETEAFLKALGGDMAAPEHNVAYAYYDAANRRFRAPLMSGPSLEPTAAWLGDEFVIGTSRSATEALIESGLPEEGPLPEPCSLYIRVDPLACTEILVETGRVLAEDGLLAGYSSEGFRKDSAVWLEKAAAIDTVTCRITITSTAVDVDLHLRSSSDAARKIGAADKTGT